MMIQNGDHAQFEIDNANIPKELRSDWPLPSFDARDWAKAFVKSVRENPNIPHDEETMIAWFAGALMRGFDEATGRARRLRLKSQDSASGDGQ